MNRHNERHNEFSEDRAEACGEPVSRNPAGNGAGLGGGGQLAQELTPTHLLSDRAGRARAQEAELDRLLEEQEQALKERESGEAFRRESKNRCADCPQIINVGHRLCRRCLRKSPRQKEYLARVNEGKFTRRENGQIYPFREKQDSYDCGCTTSSNPDVSAKGWSPPDPDCAACRGTGRIRDTHHYLKKGRKPRAAPDISIESGSYEHAGWMVDSVMDAATEEDGYSYGNDDEVEDAATFDFGSGGWSIETAAPEVPYRPGEDVPRGRPPEGICDPEQIRAISNRKMVEDDALDALWDWGIVVHIHKGGKKQRNDALRRFQEILTVELEAEDVNKAALSKVSGVPLRTVKRRANEGRKVAHNAPKGEGDEVIATEEIKQHMDIGLERLEKLIVGQWIARDADEADRHGEDVYTDTESPYKD